MANVRDQINTACPFKFKQMRTARAHNGVSMTARLAGGNDWVNASVEDRFGARQTPESVRGRYKQKPYCQKRDYHLVQKKVKKKKRATKGEEGRATVS
jgi:hypothetical protein